MSERKQSRNNPLLVAWGYAVIPLAFAVVAGIISTVLKADTNGSRMIQTISFIVSTIIALIIMRKKDSFAALGFRSLSMQSIKGILFLIPIAIVEVLNATLPQKPSMSPVDIVVLTPFVISVGFHEEIYFRGLIQSVLYPKGVRYAVIWTSIIFGIAHLGNLFGGAELLYTILQVVYAALFGLLCSLIFVHTKSLIIPILWHSIHDFSALLSGNELGAQAYISLAIECVIMLLYAIFLWRRLSRLPDHPKTL